VIKTCCENSRGIVALTVKLTFHNASLHFKLNNNAVSSGKKYTEYAVSEGMSVFEQSGLILSSHCQV